MEEEHSDFKTLSVANIAKISFCMGQLNVLVNLDEDFKEKLREIGMLEVLEEWRF